MEWDRLSLYGGFVRKFGLDFSDWPDASVPVLRILHHLGKSHVLSNIEVLDLTISGNTSSASVLSGILSPATRVVNLDFRAGLCGDYEPEAFLPFLWMVNGADLHELHITVQPRSLIESEVFALAISDSIEAQPSLKRLSVHDISNRLKSPFRAASRLLYLEGINFTDTVDGTDSWPHIQPSQTSPGVKGFSNLRTASLEFGAQDVRSTLGAISSTKITELRLWIQGPDDEDHGEDFIDELPPGSLAQIGHFVLLTSIELICAAAVISWDDLLPMVGCLCMKEVVLRGPGLCATIGNREITRLAQAWGNLRQLEIQDVLQTEQSIHSLDLEARAPKVTISGLCSLATHCPRLERLAITVDARGSMDAINSDAIGAALRDLYLPCSWLCRGADGGSLAAIIMKMWPNLDVPKSGSETLWIAQRSASSWRGEWYPITRCPLDDKEWQLVWTRVITDLNACRRFVLSSDTRARIAT